MPILEVIHAAKEPASIGQKQAFVRSAVEIFRDVLGTPDGSLRVLFYALDWEDCNAGLMEHESREDEA